MLRSELPVPRIYELLDLRFILIFGVKIQLGGENEESISFAALDHMFEDFEVMSVIVYDCGCRYKVILTIHFFRDDSVFLAKNSSLKIQIAFLVVGNLKNRFTAIHTGGLHVSFLFEILTEVPLATSDIENLNFQLVFIVVQFIDNGSTNLWREPCIEVLIFIASRHFVE